MENGRVEHLDCACERARAARAGAWAPARGAAPVPQTGAGLAERGSPRSATSSPTWKSGSGDQTLRPWPRSGRTRGGGRSRGARTPPPRGGKSFGGRMTSGLRRGILFPTSGARLLRVSAASPGRARHARANHLDAVRFRCCSPGTRDAFAELALLEPACARLEQAATLHVVEGPTIFRVPHRAGRSDADVLAELAKAVGRLSRGSCRNG